ncbi:na+/proline symporter [Clostridium sp. CAG:242]|nr:na+/proline symporter [Clostridium sp. CAG:242]
MSEGKFHLTALCNLFGIIQRFIDNCFVPDTLPHSVVHFLTGFYVELLCFKLHPVIFLQGMVCLDTDQDFLGRAVLFLQIMAVVGRNQTHSQLPGKAHKIRNNLLLLGNAMILYLNKVAVLAEHIQIKLCCFLCLCIIVLIQCPWHLTCKAGRQRNQAFRMLPEQFAVDTWLKIKTFGEAAGDHLDQVLVAGLIFTQQNQVIWRIVKTHHLIKTGSWRNIDFTADNRLDSIGFCLFVKVDGTVHYPMVGHRYRTLSKLFGTLYQLFDAARAIQKAVFTVNVQMNKMIFHPACSFLFLFFPYLLCNLADFLQTMIDSRTGYSQKLSQLPKRHFRMAQTCFSGLLEHYFQVLEHAHLF